MPETRLPWWTHGVLYEIYVRSFADSNSDGIGDLQGVVEHLDYLAWLGVDVEAMEPWMAPGRWGWTGGTGTTADVDPVRGTVSVLLTQRGMTSPLDGFGDFWAAVAAAA